MKKQAKTEILSCRVTPEQRELIEEKAFSSYRTPSMYLRQLIDKIIIYESSDGLRIQVNLRAAFTEHMIILDEFGKQNADLKVEGKYNYPFAMRRRMRVKE